MAFQPKTFHPKTPASTSTQTATQTPEESAPVTIENGTNAIITAPDVQSKVQIAIDMYRKELAEAALDEQQVMTQVVAQLNNVDVYGSHDISTMGQGSAEKIAEYSDSMLQHVRTKDLAEMGENLNQVVGIAKSVNLDGLIGKESFFGKLVSKFRDTKEAILAQFNSVSTQLDRVVVEINDQQARLQERSVQLDTVFNHNVMEYKELSQAIIYGESRKLLVEERIGQLNLDGDIQSPLKAQELSDLQTNLGRIEKRVHDLKSLQMLALQTAPMIRMIQTNNITLIEKFNNIKTMTIPSWKKQFTLAISMLEQRKSIELANNIDDATNDLIRRNAELLQQNSVQAAQANQRSVVDIETLEHVQNTLISTLQEVVAVEEEGARNRKAADEKMVTMKNELSNFLQNRQ